MLTRLVILAILVPGGFSSATLLGQAAPAASTAQGAKEFPVVMRQNVVAGKTPVGTKIRAKLEVASLVDGVVVPRDAVFSGEVIDSAAKTETDPSRLAIRVDSVLWKKGSTPVKVYLTAWYYPDRNQMGQDLQYGPTPSAKGTWNGQGQYPDPNSKIYKPFPGSDSDRGGSVPDTPASAMGTHRMLMKDVESAVGNDGAVEIISRRTNIKLDKLTTYVLATGALLPAK
jgi:hypothetical protein